jgi:hypothetical protein
MKNLILQPNRYKAVNAKGVHEYTYSVIENGSAIACWHEDRERDYTGAVVMQTASGKWTGYTCLPFKVEPDVIPDGAYGVARIKSLKAINGTIINEITGDEKEFYAA